MSNNTWAFSTTDMFQESHKNRNDMKKSFYNSIRTRYDCDNKMFAENVNAEFFEIDTNLEKDEAMAKCASLTYQVKPGSSFYYSKNAAGTITCSVLKEKDIPDTSIKQNPVAFDFGELCIRKIPKTVEK
jgi:hypothetical protein